MPSQSKEQRNDSCGNGFRSENDFFEGLVMMIKDLDRI